MLDLDNPIYTNETAAREHLEAIRWPTGPVCPHCGERDNVTRIVGQSARPGLIRCNKCTKQFTVTVGTIYESSHIPLHKWHYATHLLTSSKKGISAHQLHRMLGITYKSAWFMAHRIREAMKPVNPTPMGGTGKVVEVDETFIGQPGHVYENEKGWKAKPGIGDRAKVVALVERGGGARSIKAGSLKGHEIRAILVRNADRRSKLATDEASFYREPGLEFADHLTVNHSISEYVRGEATTNTVEGFFSIFKRGMRGIYQHCGEQHLERYLAEFDFRYSNRAKLGVDDETRAMLAIKGAAGKRLTYRRIGESA